MITTAGSEEMHWSLLACSKCRANLRFQGNQATCESCDAVVHLKDGVVVARELAVKSYFDDVFEVMQAGNHAPGTWDIFYAEQAAALNKMIGPGQVVIDIGCGPELPYAKNGAFVVGVDASFDSIRANKVVDLRIFASAAAMPLRNHVADVIVCFYSVHHMTGKTVEENRTIVKQVFQEFSRVLKPSGRLLVFDMSPWFPFATVEELVWNQARQRIGAGLDMFFWKDWQLQRMGLEALPGAKFSIRRFGQAPLRTFPPVFSKPDLRLPRFLYPFDINLYVWEGREAAVS